MSGAAATSLSGLSPFSHSDEWGAAHLVDVADGTEEWMGSA
jgi:hypothetical protein